jgi:hypothetical protein
MKESARRPMPSLASGAAGGPGTAHASRSGQGSAPVPADPFGAGGWSRGLGRPIRASFAWGWWSDSIGIRVRLSRARLATA